MNFPGKIVDRIRSVFGGGLGVVEYVGLLVIGIATSFAMYDEIITMMASRRVLLSDLLMMFLFLEVLAMIARYVKDGELPVRFPLYIAMVALARTMILDLKDMSEMRMLAIAAAILLLTFAVLVIRYGHVRYPYREDKESSKPFVHE